MAQCISHLLKDIIHQIDRRRLKNPTCNDDLKLSSVYCLKALGAFFIICIHCYAPWPIFPLIRTAVPFFFIISGYFVYREDMEKALEKCTTTLKKILWITLYANIFYYVCYYVPANLFPFTGYKSIVSFITLGATLGFHLWYLNAYIEVLIVVIIALKLRSLNILWWCIPPCIILGLITGRYEFLFPALPNNLILSRNFLTIGIPCFGIGWLLKKYSSRLVKFIQYPILLTIALFILSEVETIILRNTNYSLVGDYLITTFPLAASMIVVAIKYPFIGFNSVIETVGKKYSTYIYIFHVFILRMFLRFNSKLLDLPSVTFPFIVFGCTILFIIMWEKCSKKFFK